MAGRRRGRFRASAAVDYLNGGFERDGGQGLIIPGRLGRTVAAAREAAVGGRAEATLPTSSVRRLSFARFNSFSPRSVGIAAWDSLSFFMGKYGAEKEWCRRKEMV